MLEELKDEALALCCSITTSFRGYANTRHGIRLEKGKIKIVKGDVPLAAMFGYATSIRSLTQGRASYTMEPSHYSEVPGNIAEKIIGK